MAAAVVKHAGARFVVVTDVNPWRLELAKKLGATRVVDVREEKIADVQKELGMVEGFDVGLEMSGNATAFRDMLANMCHGGKIAMLGIPPDEIAIDWNTVIFNMLTVKGIYGRRMYETWYYMTVLIQSGLDISPVITHRFDYTEFEKGFEVMHSGESGKVIPQLGLLMNDAFREHLAGELESIRTSGLEKGERVMATPQGAHVAVNEGAEVLNLCANNYLGLSNHPEVVGPRRMMPSTGGASGSPRCASSAGHRGFTRKWKTA